MAGGRNSLLQLLLGGGKAAPPLHPRTAGRLLDGEQERQERSAGEDHAKGSANDDTEEMTGDTRDDQQAPTGGAGVEARQQR